MDPSGEQAIFPLRLYIVAPMNNKLQPTRQTAYGAYVWPADFKLTLKAPVDGVIAQQVRVTIKAGILGWSFDYWEFWNVKKGTKNATPMLQFPEKRAFINRTFPANELKGKHNDWYYYTGPGFNASGSLDWSGEAWYVKGKVPGPLSGQKMSRGVLVVPSDNGICFPLVDTRPMT